MLGCVNMGTFRTTNTGQSIPKIVLSLAILWALSAAAFGQVSNAKHDETLIVGSEQEYPPFSKGMTDSEASGFTVELWKAVAVASGLTNYKVRVLPFEDVLSGFKRGDIDVMINLAQSEERKKFADFTVPHVIVRGAAFVRDGAPNIKSEAELSSKKIIVLAADLAHDYAKVRWPGKQFLLVKNTADGMRMLASGAGDAMLVSKVAGLNSLNLTGLKGVHALPIHIGFAQKFSFAVHKGNSDLLARINEGLDVVKATGQYDRLYEKWFGVYEDHGPDYRAVRITVFLLLSGFAIFGIYALSKRAQERGASLRALQEAETRFRATFEQASVGIAHLTLDGQFILVNDRLCQIFGYSREELLERTFASITYPGDLVENLALMKRLKAKEFPSFSMNKRYLTKSGSVVSARIFISMVDESEGRAPYVVGVVEDIGDMMAATERLQESETLYRGLMEFGADAVFLATPAGKVVKVNQNAEHLLGSGQRELVGLSLVDLHPDCEKERVRAAYKQIVMTGQGTLENVLVIQVDHSERFVDISGSCFTVAGEVVLQAVLRDVTERKIAERKARVLAARLDLALRAGSIGVWTFDQGVGQLTWDARMHELFGVSPFTFSGALSDWQAIVATEDRSFLLEVAQFAYQPGLTFDHCLRVEVDGGDTRHIQVWATCEQSKDGAIGLLTGVAYDISDRIRNEQRLRHANIELEQVTKQKDEFIAKISHELRTPLNSILGFGRIFLQDAITEEQKNNVTQILRSGEHLLSLINDILDIAKVQSDRKQIQFEATDLVQVAREVCALVKPIASESKVTLSIEEPDFGNQSFAWADRQMVKQVLFNLISNGVKYNREGGLVVVSFSLKDAGRTTVRVQDTGIGIAAADYAKLFKPFERLSPNHKGVRGTGLGLSISRELVEQLGGCLTVDSMLGFGSVFEFDVETFCGQGPIDLRLEINDRPAEDSVATKTILVVQAPGVSSWQPGSEYLERSGVKLAFADSGTEALRAAKWQEPVLILVSLSLADGGASTLITRLRQSALTRSIPVVVFFDQEDPESAERVLALGVKRVVRCPVEPLEARILLSSLLELGTNMKLTEARA